MEATSRMTSSTKKERDETKQGRQKQSKEIAISWQRNHSEALETNQVDLTVNGKREIVAKETEGLDKSNGYQQNSASNAKAETENKANSSTSETVASVVKPWKKSKRRETRQDRRRQRKEIVLGWQRNTPATLETNLAKALGERPSMQCESKTSGRGKRIEESVQASTEEICGVVPVKRPPPTTKSRLSPRASTRYVGHRLSPVADTVSKNVQRSSPRRPGQRRVSQSTGSDRSRSRSKSRGTRRRLKTSKEEVTLSWTREPQSYRREKRISGAARVDKEVLVEVARRLETQKRYEKDKLEAIGKMRGRRYRTGVLPGVTRSRSPRPRTRKRDQTVEIQITWQRQLPSEKDAGTRLRRSESGTASLGRGIVRRDSTARRKARTINSGDDIPLDRRSQGSLRRIRSIHIAPAVEGQAALSSTGTFSDFK